MITKHKCEFCERRRAWCRKQHKRTYVSKMTKVCKNCGEPIQDRNESGYCSRTLECMRLQPAQSRQSRREYYAAWYAKNKTAYNKLRKKRRDAAK